MRTVRAVAIVILVFGACAAADGTAQHQEHDHDAAEHAGHDRADGLAPIGVMAEHTHPAGGFMVSYRYSRMRMDGNRDGTHRRKTSQVKMPGGTYMVSPTDMDMEMHMFGAMYAPTDWLTLTAMIPYVKLSMDHVMVDGTNFTTDSDGPGDLRLAGLFTIFEREDHHVHLNAGLSFPTGGIGHKDQVPVPAMGFQNRRLPYPMQIGSGTWDLLPGMTYTGRNSLLSWGGQALGTVRLGHRNNGYRLGNRVDSTAWLAAPLLDWLSVSGRIAYSYWGNIHGSDSSLNPNAVPTADPDLRAGHRLDLLGGLNIIVPLGHLGDHRFGVEAGAPVFQSLDGPQLETDWRVIAGWQLLF